MQIISSDDQSCSWNEHELWGVLGTNCRAGVVLGPGVNSDSLGLLARIPVVLLLVQSRGRKKETNGTL